MKKIIMLCLSFILMCTYSCFAGNVYTAEQLKKIVAKECKDEIYQEYSLSRALLHADSTNFCMKPNLFDCDDVARAVRSIIIHHISELNDSGGAVIVDLAFLKLSKDRYHVINIMVEKKKVYLYDWQKAVMKNIVDSPEYYLNRGNKFMLIWF